MLETSPDDADTASLQLGHADASRSLATTINAAKAAAVPAIFIVRRISVSLCLARSRRATPTAIHRFINPGYLAWALGRFRIPRSAPDRQCYVTGKTWVRVGA